MDWQVYVVEAVIWVLSLFLAWRKREGDSLLSRLFTTNEDLDSTLSVILRMLTVIGVFALVIVMIIYFHDDIKDDAGMITISAIGMISLAIRDMFPGSKEDGKT